MLLIKCNCKIAEKKTQKKLCIEHASHRLQTDYVVELHFSTKFMVYNKHVTLHASHLWICVVSYQDEPISMLFKSCDNCNIL